MTSPKAGLRIFCLAVGEVNLVEMMKKTKRSLEAKVTGESSIRTTLRRDALVGVALFLSHLAQQCLQLLIA